ncbi:triose-phosphate isomerase, partial [Desulfovibrio sp.]
MQKIIAANWKMYKTRQEARETAAAVAAALNEQPTPHEVVVFAPFTAIAEVADAFAASQAQAGAQDVWPAVEGAFTGEISPRMLQDAGAVWVLTGHSE